MSWFNKDSHQAQAYEKVDEVDPNKHSASTAHQVLSGAAAYAAMKAYEHHQAKNGKPVHHKEAYAIAAGAAGALVDRLVETKGLDAIDGFKKDHAKKEAEKQIDEQLRQEYPH